MEDNENRVPEEEYESNAARRLRLAGGGAEREPEPEPEPQKTNFFANFWYHYKAPFLIAIFVLVVLAVGITQMVRNGRPDIYVIYAGPVGYDNTGATAAETALSSIVSEETTHTVRYTTILYVSPDKAAAAAEEAKKKNEWSPLERYATSQENRDAYAAFSNDMLAGDSVICLLDPYLFETVRDAGGFLPLSEVVGYTPEGAVDEYGVPARLIGFFASNDAFSNLPEDTVFAVRRVSTMSAFTGKKKEEEAHARHLAFARAIFAYSAEDETAD